MISKRGLWGQVEETATSEITVGYLVTWATNKVVSFRFGRIEEGKKKINERKRDSYPR